MSEESFSKNEGVVDGCLCVCVCVCTCTYKNKTDKERKEKYEALQLPLSGMHY